MNEQEGARVVAVLDPENGVIFMAGHVMNFFRGVRHAKQLIA